MGRAEREKGARVERGLVHLHRDAGIDCERVPLSGAAGGRFGGDLVVADCYRAEVKSRAGGAGFRTLERWLADHALLFLKRDRQPPLVVMPWAVYARLMGGEAAPTEETSP